jgi:uncharacterized protein YkwD
MTRSFKISLLIILATFVATISYLSHLDVEVVGVGKWYNLATEQTVGKIRDFVKIENEVVTSEPLYGPTANEEDALLTVLGTIKETNLKRAEYGLPPLESNSLLAKAAEMKVDDMFTRQYFEHESPTGEGPGDLARAAGYQFLMVGENLALGNYENDQVLVEAWMDSPGHRENILTEKYSEIGVSVKKGLYEGKMVWLAVQEFGRPASECPSTSAGLNEEIESKKALLLELEVELSEKQAELEATTPKSGPQYNRKVDEYNALVNQYNVLVSEVKGMVVEYNAQVNAYNACVQGG